ncbi:hypothetical protein [Burkholderia sp. NRF60-BP8]|uniref:hypothetical protein n=1 Tax=Burkholderia sp. NRF60-BP8 TaxID=1637853 RepID=UPI00075EDEB8|nr:hypothetical protein [Burkholderia sp. NRF60-BP8]AOI76079.1 hypothetical protein WS54_07205 [Burkholderia sp. NRF60-BP8]
MKMWTKHEEAEALAARFEGVDRAKFARDHDFPGGQAMIYQHITGRRPMNLTHARIYAQGFGCSLEEISPRLAQETQEAADTLKAPQQGITQKSSQSSTLFTKLAEGAGHRLVGHNLSNVSRETWELISLMIDTDLMGPEARSNMHRGVRSAIDLARGINKGKPSAETTRKSKRG